jgi:mercuric ion transport protein
VRERILNMGATVGSVAAGITSTAASICCIGPLAIALLGVNGAILAAGIKPYRPYLLGGSLLMLGYAFWRIYRPRASADVQTCSVRAGRWSRLVLWAAAVLWVLAVVIQIAADRYWLSGIG